MHIPIDIDPSVTELAERTRQRGERSLQESEANVKQAAAVRRRYDERTNR